MVEEGTAVGEVSVSTKDGTGGGAGRGRHLRGGGELEDGEWGTLGR